MLQTDILQSSVSMQLKLHSAPCAAPPFLLLPLWLAHPGLTTLSLPSSFLLFFPYSSQLKPPALKHASNLSPCP